MLVRETFISKNFQKTFLKAMFCNVCIVKGTNFNTSEVIGKQNVPNFSFFILILRSSRF